VRKYASAEQLKEVVLKFVPSSCPVYEIMIQYIDKLPAGTTEESSEEKQGMYLYIYMYVYKYVYVLIYICTLISSIWEPQ
jgi:hypothetical protein